MILQKDLWSDAIAKMKQDPLLIWSCLCLLGYFFLLIFADLGWIATDFATSHMDQAYSPPSREYWFGTDFLGRNVMSRAIQGTRTALIVGFFAATISTIIGLVLGTLSGYFGGRIDDFVVWLYSTLDSIPYILLISAFAFTMGQGLLNLYLALGLTGWVRLCRLTRGEVLKHRNQDYVVAAQAMGASNFRRMVFHILPNVVHIALIQYSLFFVYAIKVEVILSYLGLGVEPGTPSWGTMINDAKVELARGVWWNLAAATFFMFFLILAINLLMDGLRSALDPKMQAKNL